MNTEQVIAYLQLEPHPEGGFFRRSYTAEAVSQNTEGEARAALSSIYYLLSADQPLGRMHCNRSDIVHYYHGEGRLRYTLIRDDGQIEQHILGRDLAAGEQLQLTVPGGWWKASELLDGDYGLISEAVCPGFDYSDHRFGDEALAERFPQLRQLILPH